MNLIADCWDDGDEKIDFPLCRTWFARAGCSEECTSAEFALKEEGLSCPCPTCKSPTNVLGLNVEHRHAFRCLLMILQEKRKEWMSVRGLVMEALAATGLGAVLVFTSKVDLSPLERLVSLLLQ